MGGKALAQMGIETRRVRTQELIEISDEIMSLIEIKLKLKSAPVVFYRNKIDHGDADILVKIDRPNVNLKEFVLTHITNNVHNNGGTVSFEYKMFQVDLIPVPAEKWEISGTFFSYSPLGNLMGKIAHRFGLKYGFSGLVYPFRSMSGINFADIEVSTDARRIFEFLGYDYYTYEKGFDTEESIFDYVINGKFFIAEKFYMENLGSIDRKRNNKRADYQRFLNYINLRRDELPACTIPELDDKTLYLGMIDQAFPECGLLDRVNQLKLKDERHREISSKFNGRIVMQVYPELSDKSLGDALLSFKALYTDFDTYVYNTSKEKIMEDFNIFYKNLLCQNQKEE